MIRIEMREDYFKWICNLISNRGNSAYYKKLLRYLFDTDFIYVMERDENRAIDGFDLRYRYAYDRGISYDDADHFLGDRKCSMLEMMVALSNRIEEQIMCDPDIGNRTGKWFWDMIKNLGLDGMNDKRFDLKHVSIVIDKFLHREYQANGHGGLVCIPNCEHDLRNVEIWYQVMWYLTKFY